MAKQGMKRPSSKETKNMRKNNDEPPVPEIQGKAKAGHKKAKPILYDDME